MMGLFGKYSMVMGNGGGVYQISRRKRKNKMMILERFA